MELGSPPSLETVTAVMTAIASTARPPAGISIRRTGGRRRPPNEGRGRRERRGKPAAARSSSSAANSGRGVGRSARSSAASWSSLGVSIAGLPQLGHGAVQLRAGVGLADAEHPGDLTVFQAGEELERDQLALARLQPLQ